MLKPTVLYIDQCSGFGGAVSVLANSLPFLRQRGLEIHVVLTYSDRRAEDSLRGACEQVHILPYQRRPNRVNKRLEALGRRSKLIKWAYLLVVTLNELVEKGRWLIGLNQLMRQIRPDIVHGNNGPEYNGSALLVAWAMGIRTVVSVRGPDRRTLFGRIVERLCDREVFVAEHLRKAMASRNKHTTVIYDGLDLERWPTQTSDGGGSAIRIGHLGMFTAWKGQNVFLQAATLVAEQSPAAEFYLFGDVIDRARTKYKEGLQAIVRDSGHADSIHFMGFQSDVRQALLGLDILVHSSTSAEPFGMVVLEGMVAGLAVIASDEGGPREIIHDGVDGLLVRPRDPRVLADAIERLIREPDMIRILGQAARRRVMEEFTAERTAEGLASLYVDLVRK